MAIESVEGLEGADQQEGSQETTDLRRRMNMIGDEIKDPDIGEEQEQGPPCGKGVEREGMPEGGRNRGSKTAREGALISGMVYGRDGLRERCRQGQELKQAEEKKEQDRQIEGGGPVTKWFPRDKDVQHPEDAESEHHDLYQRIGPGMNRPVGQRGKEQKAHQPERDDLAHSFMPLISLISFIWFLWFISLISFLSFLSFISWFGSFGSSGGTK
jgi:hypothetical protein